MSRSRKNTRTPTFGPGMRVLCRDARWRITGIETLRGVHGHALHCQGVDRFILGQERIFFTHLDEVTKLEAGDTRLRADDGSAGYRRSLLYLESHLRQAPAAGRIVPWERLGVFDPHPFQKDTLRRVLRQPDPRILIADAVGLGKTIQAGLILAELMRRRRADRILVVAKKSMLAQFQAELWNRFNIPLIRLDSRGVARLRQRIPANRNPFEIYRRIIISMDTLKDHARYERFLLDTHWDAVVIDEAHNVAGASGSENHLSNRLARVLARRSDAFILTTATPHNGKPATFGRLISLVDRTAIADPDLEEYEASDIADTFVMRFKEDVRSELGDRLRDRIVVAREKTSAQATPAEEELYAQLADLRKQASEAKSRDRLARYGIYKMFLSSPEACQATLRKRLSSETGGSDSELIKLQDAASKLSLVESSRFQLLLSQLQTIGWDGGKQCPRVLIFTEYRETQRALSEAIASHFKIAYGQRDEEQQNQTIAVIHGGTADTHLMATVEAFATGEAPVRMMIATDVASEGINLHHQCHHVIHYDLPWSIITLVQRNGRIDRIGQTQVPEIRYLMVETQDDFLRGDTAVFDRLIEKVEEINRLRKDEGSVLALYDAQKEEEYVAEHAVLAESPQALDEAADRSMSSFADLLLKSRALAPEIARDQDTAPDVPTKLDPGSYRVFSDADFFRAGYSFLREARSDYPAFKEAGGMFTLAPPEDLKRRLGAPDSSGDVISGATEIPLEAWSDDGTLRFSDRTDRITGAIEAARNSRAGHWSRELYLNEQHPVLHWIQERMALEFSRGEAPFIVSPHLKDDEILFCFIAVTCSKSGYPLFTLPHAIGIEGGGKIGRPEPLDQALARAKITELANQGEGDPTVAQMLVKSMVEQSMIHCEKQSKDLHGELAETIRDELRGLKSWAKKRHDYLAQKKEKAANNKQRDRFETRITELRDYEKRHEQRINERFDRAESATELVLVISGAGTGPARGRKKKSKKSSEKGLGL